MTTFDPDQVRQRIADLEVEAVQERFIADALRGHADDHDYLAREARDRADHLTHMLSPKVTTP